MAPRTNPSKGGKPDKIIRDAIMVAIQREHDDGGRKTTKLKALVAKLVDKAASGDIFAIREVADRIDGKPAQALAIGQDAEAGPLLMRWEN